MNNFFYFVSLIERPKGGKNQNNKGDNGTMNAKCKILLQTIGGNYYLLAVVCSNKEARRASKRLRSGSLVRITMGSEEENFHFLSDTPVIHVSNLETINFYKAD